MSSDRLRVAVIIVSYNVRSLLESCLASVFGTLERSPELKGEVWVVDNASADGSAEMVRQRFPQVQLIASQNNLGFAGGNNVALRALGFGQKKEEGAGRELPGFVLLLNPDTEVRGQAIAELARFLAGHPGAGVAGARLLYPDGSFQHGAFRFPNLWQLFFDFFPLHGRLLDSRLNGRYPRRWYQAGKPFPVDFVLGAALMARREAIQQVGLLDEGYFMYCEEIDWCRRMNRAGWQVYCVPQAVVVHHSGQSARQRHGEMYVALWRSRYRMFEKYSSPTFRWLARRLVRLGMWVEALRARQQVAAGAISPQKCAELLAAYRQVAAL